MKNLKNRNYSELHFTTHRRIVKSLERRDESFDDRYIPHCRLGAYRYQETDVYEHYIKPLFEDEYDYYHKSWSNSYKFPIKEYGTTWEWYREKTHTVIIDKRPNWKLISKNKKQWMKKNTIYGNFRKKK